MWADDKMMIKRNNTGKLAIEGRVCGGYYRIRSLVRTVCFPLSCRISSPLWDLEKIKEQIMRCLGMAIPKASTLSSSQGLCFRNSYIHPQNQKALVSGFSGPSADGCIGPYFIFANLQHYTQKPPHLHTSIPARFLQTKYFRKNMFLNSVRKRKKAPYIFTTFAEFRRFFLHTCTLLF